MSSELIKSSEGPELIKYNDRHLWHFKQIDPNSDPEQPGYRIFHVLPHNLSLFEHNPAYVLVHEPEIPVHERPIPGPLTEIRITVFAKNKKKLAPAPKNKSHG